MLNMIFEWQERENRAAPHSRAAAAQRRQHLGPGALLCLFISRLSGISLTALHPYFCKFKVQRAKTLVADLCLTRFGSEDKAQFHGVPKEITVMHKGRILTLENVT